MVWADWRNKIRPTSVEPVNDNLRTRESAHSTWPMAGAAWASPTTTLKTPAGMPAR